mmetsp:Transcript_65399/g.77417  ORF Transcript_65399/g.77417 Transcript_65399/m.77417 type:complete len:80 (-) Transcript_65399:116-355(-)
MSRYTTKLGVPLIKFRPTSIFAPCIGAGLEVVDYFTSFVTDAANGPQTLYWFYLHHRDLHQDIFFAFVVFYPKEMDLET